VFNQCLFRVLSIWMLACSGPSHPIDVSPPPPHRSTQDPTSAEPRDHTPDLDSGFNLDSGRSRRVIDSGDSPDASPEPTPPLTPRAPSVASSRATPPPTFIKAVPRLVAIGDVHGDLSATLRALKLSGAIDDSTRWVGGNLVVVQVGDQLDRGGDEQAILDLFERLSDEAHQAGGGLYPLIGNHEVMNVLGDWRYVFPEGWTDFEEFADRVTQGDPALSKLPPAYHGRAVAFKPGGPYANLLARHNVIMVVGDTLFVHGGVLPHHVRYGFEKINQETQSWMRGERRMPSMLRGKVSPVWSRHYSKEVRSTTCDVAAQMLKLAQVKRIVVAHTVQRQGVNSICGGRVWRVDVGLSAHYKGTVQVLEIKGDQVKVIE
jgi:hypothetical protein